LRDDITRIWPTAEVIDTPHADYAYRAAVAERDVISAVAQLLHGITYATDFKGGVKERRRHDAYVKVWAALKGLRASTRA